MCAPPVSHRGPLGEAFDLVFAFTKHVPPWGHEHHLHVLIAHNLQMGFGVQGGIPGLEKAGAGSQRMSGHRSLLAFLRIYYEYVPES